MSKLTVRTSVNRDSTPKLTYGVNSSKQSLNKRSINSVSAGKDKTSSMASIESSTSLKDSPTVKPRDSSVEMNKVLKLLEKEKRQRMNLSKKILLLEKNLRDKEKQ